MNKCFCCAKNIQKNCVIVCQDCNCFAHESCMDIYTFSCGINTSSADNLIPSCPLCKKQLTLRHINKKNITKPMYISKLKLILASINTSYTRERKIQLIEILFNILIETKNILIKQECNFSLIVQRKLQELYYNENWQLAEYYYEKIFNTTIKI